MDGQNGRLRVLRWAIIVATAALAAFLIALARTPRAHAATLTCTAPTAGQLWTRIFDPEAGDSTWSAECSGGPAIHDSLWVVLWGQPLGGGGYSGRDSVRVAPGDSVHFLGVGPGHYYAVARNNVGPSCVTSAPVYVPPLDPTDVPTDPSPEADPVITCRMFDVQGRLVGFFAGNVWDALEKSHGAIERDLLLRGVTNGRLAAGVYFVRGTTRAGNRTPARRVVVLR